MRLANIERQLGEIDAGERHYRQAIDKLEAIAAGQPSGRDVLDPLSTGYVGLGLVLADAGRRDESKQAFRHASELERQVILCIPETTANAALLAERYHLLGAALARDGRYQEAEGAYRKAIALRAQIGQPQPARQASAFSSLAGALDREGKRSEAERLYQQAIEFFDAAQAHDPSIPQYRAELAETLIDFSKFLGKNSQNAEPAIRRDRGV